MNDHVEPEEKVKMKHTAITVAVFVLVFAGSCGGDRFGELLYRVQRNELSRRFYNFSVEIKGVVESTEVLEKKKKSKSESEGTTKPSSPDSSKKSTKEENVNAVMKIMPVGRSNGYAVCNMLPSETSRVKELKKGEHVTVEGRLRKWSAEGPVINLYECEIVE